MGLWISHFRVRAELTAEAVRQRVEERTGLKCVLETDPYGENHLTCPRLKDGVSLRLSSGDLRLRTGLRTHSVYNWFPLQVCFAIEDLGGLSDTPCPRLAEDEFRWENLPANRRPNATTRVLATTVALGAWVYAVPFVIFIVPIAALGRLANALRRHE